MDTEFSFSSQAIEAARRSPNFGKTPPRLIRRKIHSAPAGEIGNAPIHRGCPRDQELNHEVYGPDVVTAKDFNQTDFQSIGAAKTQNAKLIEFFKQRHNFNKWFTASFLEQLSGSTRMNNRAIDIRPYFISGGLYIDNFMIKPNKSGPAKSHYRLCRIEDALSLTPEEKSRLISSPSTSSTNI